MSFKFEYLGKIDVIFSSDLGYESAGQVGSFYEKKNGAQILMQVYLSAFSWKLRSTCLMSHRDCVIKNMCPIGTQVYRLRPKLTSGTW